MVRNIQILLQSINLCIANVRPVQERTQEQKRQDGNDPAKLISMGLLLAVSMCKYCLLLGHALHGHDVKIDCTPQYKEWKHT